MEVRGPDSEGPVRSGTRVETESGGRTGKLLFRGDKGVKSPREEDEGLRSVSTLSTWVPVRGRPLHPV